MNQEQNNLVYLYNQLLSSFNESELRDLSFKLNVPYEDLPGNTRKDKARELIKYLDRRGRIGELPEIVQDVSVERFPIRKVQMRWVSPFIVAAITLLLISALWMWYEPGFEPLIAVIGGMSGVTVAVFYEKSDKKLPNQIELLISLAIIVVALAGFLIVEPWGKNQSPAVNVTPTSPTLTTNHPPEVTLSATSRIIKQGEQITITAIVNDSEEDFPHEYHWTAMVGEVPSDNIFQIVYTAPTSYTGLDTVTVLVIDSWGESSSEKIKVSIER